MHSDPYVSLSQDPWHSGARGLALGVKLFSPAPGTGSDLSIPLQRRR